MEVTIQIFSGGFRSKTVTYELVEQKLLCLSGFPVSKVIMGWSTDKELYQRTAQFLEKRNIEFYLWFPVFSETGSIRDLAPLVDFKGQRVTGSGTENQDEDFSFCCPNDKQNIDKIIDIFETNFASIPFNGIFPDKIRYPSFANGQSPGNVYTCFCPECLKTYEEENIDISLLREKLGTCRMPGTPIDITHYKGNGEYLFKDQIISDFFKLKGSVIFKSLSRICGFFREKGLGIGLDVFAPFLSPFVGQNLQKLSGLCDFIKPMMYRATNAPAGLPLETEVLLRQAGSLSDVFNFDLLKKPFDLDFAVEDLKGMTSSSLCPVYAGLEINRAAGIADVYPAYIEETVNAYAGTGVRGFALSWNILDTPQENIAKVSELFLP